jgi:hypothetical protein
MTQLTVVVKRSDCWVVQSGRMAKDTRLTLRVDSLLKNELEAIAAREGRSVAQVTEAFLRRGLKTYKQKGSKSIQDYITRRKPESR